MVRHTRGSADWFRHRKRDLIEHAKAVDAFSAAFRSFESLSKLPADVDVEIRSALSSSAVVSYGRPFKESTFQAVRDAWTKDPSAFKINPHHLIRDQTS